MNVPRIHTQRGIALITVILMMAIVTTLVMTMMEQQVLHSRRSGNMMHADQLHILVYGIEDWVKQILAEDARNSETDDTNESWAAQLPQLTIEGGSAQAQLTDLQSRFNLNTLIYPTGKPNTKAIQQFQRLLRSIDRNINEDLAGAVVDWIDQDSERQFIGGKEDQDYLNTGQPYRAANQPFINPSELLLVAGVTLQIYHLLKDYITVLPGHTKINVNTASVKVIASLSEDMDEASAQDLVTNREKTPFETVEDFIELAKKFSGKSFKDLDQKTLAVNTQFFLLSSRMQLGRGEIRQYSLLERRKRESGRPYIAVIQRTQRIY